MQPIKLTTVQNETLMQKLYAAVSNMKIANGKIDVKLDVADILLADLKKLPKPIIYFTPTAWVKMNSLVAHNKEEIGWHGTVARLDDRTYLIEDIIVFPQRVTGASVTPDAEVYAQWLYAQPDEIFNVLRFHGHSHVNMGVSPSGVDMNWRENILSQLNNDDFYIFMILNKRHDVEIALYDLKTNCWYEKNDVEFSVYFSNGKDLDMFLIETDDLIEPPKVYAPATPIAGKTTGAKTNGGNMADEHTYLGEESVRIIHQPSTYGEANYWERMGYTKNPDGTYSIAAPNSIGSTISDRVIADQRKTGGKNK